MRFDGATFDPVQDGDRLASQLARVQDVMSDGAWRTLAEIAAGTGDRSEASISARLRDLRKPRFGSLIVERRRRPGAEVRGLFEYRLRAVVGREPAQQALRLPEGGL